MARTDPPRLLQIVREPINAGGEAAYEEIESETAAACVALKCPHPHLAVETLAGPREIWWFNFFESEAQRLQVDDAARRASGGATVLGIRPSWGLPAKEWIDADRDFWSANPLVYQPGRAEQ